MFCTTFNKSCMDYVIAIPSLSREITLVNKTLKTLVEHKIDLKLVYIFIIKEEEAQYMELLNASDVTVVIGEKGIIEQRAFIQNYFPIGKHMVCLDDDIMSVDLSLTDYTSLHQFFMRAFMDCKLYKSFIWGVYPVENPYYREPRKALSTELTFIVGAFYGVINRGNLFTLVAPQKEDVAQSIMYFINDGIVLRYNRVGFKTIYFSGGGLGGLKQRLLTNQQSAETLALCFADYGKIKVKSNGLYNFDLKKIPARIPLPHVSVEQYAELYDELELITVPLKKGDNSRRGFGAHRSMTFGLVRQRKTGIVTDSANTKEYKHIYSLIKKIGEQLQFKFSSVHLNNNVVCPPHHDSKNSSVSLLVSFGDYVGCNIVVEGQEYDTNMKPIIFDGAKYEHWNTPLVSGNKYSLVFYNHGQTV